MSDGVMRAVALLMDWRLVRTFRCTAVVDLGSEQLFDLHAEPSFSSYVAVNRRSGRQSSFVDATRKRTEEDRHVPYQSSDLIWQHFAARLAFPFNLPIWGRRHDRFQMTDADGDGEQMVVRLVDRGDEALRGTLTIDVQRGLATKIDVPALRLEYRDIEPVPSYLREIVSQRPAS